MAPKKDKLLAPPASTACTVAGIVGHMAELTLDVNPGDGKSVELCREDGTRTSDFRDIMVARTSSFRPVSNRSRVCRHSSARFVVIWACFSPVYRGTDHLSSIICMQLVQCRDW
jgi:hypothetical protein